MKPKNYEHSEDLRQAEQDLADLRKRVRRMYWMSGGRGYDNMGRRELEQVRIKLDEASFWLSAATRSLNAGGERAIAEGFGRAPEI